MSTYEEVLSFDIELNDGFEDGKEPDLKTLIPSVAAIASDKTGKDLKFFYDIPYMTRETGKKLVDAMMDYYKRGIPVFGWNTTSFDLHLLGEYSGCIEECGELALNGIDGMLLLTFNKGYFLALDTALAGAGIEGKTHEVTLNDGTKITDMGGKKAPELWRAGEHQAVMTYLEGDVIKPLSLYKYIKTNSGIKWVSKKGSLMFCKQAPVTVKELFELPIPDTSWMTTPAKPRSEFVNWIPKEILKRNGIELEN